LLLAVSGGLDSTVMAHLFQRAGIPCAVVHVHYGLRGEESTEDMRFVAALAKHLGFPFHLYDAAAEMRNTPKPEIQKAARDIRYRVFGEICAQYGYRTIVLAHHRDDQEEHFWMYRKRGNMLSALSGIPSHRPLNPALPEVNLIRPLLFARREELRAFAQNEGIFWREDSSNATLHYERNRLRLSVIPALKAAHPEAYNRLMEKLDTYHPVFRVFRGVLKSLQPRFVAAESTTLLRLDRDVILAHPLGLFWLKPYLAGFGFHADLALRIFRSGKKSGLHFRGKTEWTLHSHAEGWYLIKETHRVPEPVLLQREPGDYPWNGGLLRIRLISPREAHGLPRNESSMLFDADVLHWPLELRCVRSGDRMLKPSGGHRRVGDLFTDMKIPRFKRPLWPLLFSGTELIALPGLMRSGAFLLNNHTQRVLWVSWNAESAV